jgi:hypothetical protein
MDIDAFEWFEPEEFFRTILHPQFKLVNLPKLSVALCLSRDFLFACSRAEKVESM